MTDTIKTIDLIEEEVKTQRSIVLSVTANSLDINQCNGTYSCVEPYDSSGGYNGRVLIYPQSLVSDIAQTIELKSFLRYGALQYPLDAKFDYLRQKIWIADTGNNRVLKVDLKTNQVDIAITDIIYPYALSVNLNNGNIFIRGYITYNLNNQYVFYYDKNGVLLSKFWFDNSTDSSSSSSSGNSVSDSEVSYPSLSSSKTMVFDHVRSRLWWVSENIVYMFDIRNGQIQTYDIDNNGFYNAISIDVELATGNAFFVAQDKVHDEFFLIQMYRDNNNILAESYIGKW